MEERLPLRRIAMSAYSVIITAAAGFVTGIFNGGISAAGYIPPEAVSVAPELTDASKDIHQCRRHHVNNLQSAGCREQPVLVLLCGT